MLDHHDMAEASLSADDGRRQADHATPHDDDVGPPVEFARDAQNARIELRGLLDRQRVLPDCSASASCQRIEVECPAQYLSRSRRL